MELLVYAKAIDLCVLILNPAALLDCLMHFSSSLVESLVCAMYRIITYANEHHLNSCFLICISAPIPFPPLMIWLKHPGLDRIILMGWTCLSESGSWWKCFHCFPIHYDAGCGFFVYCLYCHEECSFYTKFAYFIMKGCCILSSAFFHLLKQSYG